MYNTSRAASSLRIQTRACGAALAARFFLSVSGSPLGRRIRNRLGGLDCERARGPAAAKGRGAGGGAALLSRPRSRGASHRAESNIKTPLRCLSAQLQLPEMYHQAGNDTHLNTTCARVVLALSYLCC